MTDFLERTQILVGERALQEFQKLNIFIAGLGGVGAYTVEALARAGITKMTIHDADTISVSNINRQIIAVRSTLGRKKADVMKERIADINPLCQVSIQDTFIASDNVHQVLNGQFDIVVDAIDVFNCKLAFLIHAYNSGYKIYSSLGAGSRMDPTQIKTGDLFESRNCRLAKLIRKYLRQKGINQGIRAVWSNELPHPPQMPEENSNKARPIHGTISTVPGIFGLTLAGLIINDFYKELRL